MALTLAKTQAISDLAEYLSAFLPGKPHPFADPAISFRGIASDLGLGSYWADGSKTPAVASLLEGTLEHHPKKFCTVVLETVRRGIRYRQKKEPITQGDIAVLRSLVHSVGFRIRDLEDSAFLRALPEPRQGHAGGKRAAVDKAVLERLMQRLEELGTFAPAVRESNSSGF